MSELHGESSNPLRERQGVASSQPADVPGRWEPGTGELNYTAIASALQEMGYAGVVGPATFVHGPMGVSPVGVRAHLMTVVS